MLELLAAAAWAVIVPSHVQIREASIFLLHPFHDACGRLAQVDEFGQNTQFRADGVEKILVGLAKVIEVFLTIFTNHKTVFGAFAVAKVEHITFPANTWQGILLVPAKTALTAEGRFHLFLGSRKISMNGVV